MGIVAGILAFGILTFPLAASGQASRKAQSSAQPPAQSSPTSTTKEWYEQGPWPLLGAVAALIVTNAVSVGIVYLQSARAFNAVLKQRRIEALSTSLREFYNPLLAILDINSEVFIKTGPPSFPTGQIESNAAALVWKETKQLILLNNNQILEILRSKTHLLHPTDNFDAYQKLLVHVAMYEIFQRVETDRYSAFQFPGEVRAHVATVRSVVLREFDKLAGSQI